MLFRNKIQYTVLNSIENVNYFTTVWQHQRKLKQKESRKKLLIFFKNIGILLFIFISNLVLQISNKNVEISGFCFFMTGNNRFQLLLPPSCSTENSSRYYKIYQSTLPIIYISNLFVIKKSIFMVLDKGYPKSKNVGGEKLSIFYFCLKKLLFDTIRKNFHFILKNLLFLATTFQHLLKT